MLLRRALLVESDEAMRDHLHKKLHKLGYSVTLAKDAQTALKLLETGLEIHFALVDAQSAGAQDGWAFAKTCRTKYPSLGLLVTVGPGASQRHADWADLTFPVLQRARLSSESEQTQRLSKSA